MAGIDAGAGTPTAGAALDATRTTGTSPGNGTVHLLGVGGVGRALLQHLAMSGRRLVAATDSGATVASPAGLDPLQILAWKAAGRPLHAWPGAWAVPAEEALTRVAAGLVVDATATNGSRPGWASSLDQIIERGSALALAAKDALAARATQWLDAPDARVGCNAVLGGTGQAFVRELPELRRRWRAAALVGNASTTVILECVERGGTLTQGIEEARQRGYLESDVELDLRGRDAAVKLAIVAGALLGTVVDPAGIDCEDIRAVDPDLVRSRVARGATTRLVARASASGLHVRYEEVARASVLAAPVGRVVYRYDLSANERRLHLGGGLGAAATAEALWRDVVSLGSVRNRAALVHAGGLR